MQTIVKKIPFWLLKAMKIGLGTSFAVLVCELLGMQNATFAGIVTLLTIRNTKRDTMHIAGKRFFSFVCSMVVLVLLWVSALSSSAAFAVFMILLAMASCAAGWEDTISVNAVVGGRVLLLTPTITVAFFCNEVALLAVGIGTAILFNWYMPGKRTEILQDIAYIEQELKSVLTAIAGKLQTKEPLATQPTRILALKTHIEHAAEKSLDDMNNTLTVAAHAESRYYVEYLAMRKNQCALLLQCHQALQAVSPDDAEVQDVATIILEIGEAVHHKAGIRNIIAELEAVVSTMKTEALPKTNLEFASAVQLFYVLELLEEILREKREFLKAVTKREKELYWAE